MFNIRTYWSGAGLNLFASLLVCSPFLKAANPPVPKRRVAGEIDAWSGVGQVKGPLERMFCLSHACSRRLHTLV